MCVCVCLFVHCVCVRMCLHVNVHMYIRTCVCAVHIMYFLRVHVDVFHTLLTTVGPKFYTNIQYLNTVRTIIVDVWQQDSGYIHTSPYKPQYYVHIYVCIFIYVTHLKGLLSPADLHCDYPRNQLLHLYCVL